MISYEDTIPTRLVECHDVDALIIVPLDGGGSVTVADGEVHGDFCWTGLHRSETQHRF